jgi:hypothetical protein
VRVSETTIATRPTRLPPQVEGAHHHLCRVGRAVVQPGNVTRPEAAGPMRFFQLTSETRLTLRHASEREEAILKVTRQQRAVLQVLGRFSLRVQQPLYALDDLIAPGQEEAEKFDMCLKRHVTQRLPGALGDWRTGLPATPPFDMSRSAVSLWTSMRWPPRLLPPARPIA